MTERQRATRRGPRIAPGGLRELGPAIWAFSRIAGHATNTAPPAIFTTLGRGRAAGPGTSSC